MANPFTPEQISQILEEFFKVVGTRQYIGARYVPIFGRKCEESIEWDNSAPYEPLTIVLYQGNSYTSRQYVPVGVEITNQEFWALTGNYNAQVEQYRRDVQAFDGRISANATAITAEKTRAEDAERANATAITAETTRATKAESNNAAAIAANNTVTTLHSNQLAGTVDSGLKNLIDTEKESIGFTSRSADKVVIFSDSTFQVNRDPRTGVDQKSVVDWLETLAPNMSVDNRGISGSNSKRLLNLVNSLDASSISNATFVVVAYGTNDWQGGTQLFDLNGSMKDTMQRLYDAAIARICQLAPKAKILCVTPAYGHSTEPTQMQPNMPNINVSGLNIYAYGDMIEHIAAHYNCACLRLDRLLSINELNYTTQMVPSNNYVFVHYAEETNRRIAMLLLNMMYGATNPSYDSVYTDVTPVEAFRCGYGRTYQYYKLGTFQNMWGPYEFKASLLPNTTYWVTLVGGACGVTVNGIQLIKPTDYQGVYQFPVTTSEEDKNNFDFSVTDFKSMVSRPVISIGRPSIFDVISKLSGEFSTNKCLSSPGFCIFPYVTTVTLPLEKNTPIGSLGAGFIGQVNQDNALIIGKLSDPYTRTFSMRCSKDKVYPNGDVEKIGSYDTAYFAGFILTYV